jgi:hypothetical protein
MIIRIKSSKNMEQENVIKKSNAENNRAYRERKGEEINARRREQRNKNRAIETVKIEYEVKKLKKIGKLPEIKQKEGISDITKNNYISYIKNFYTKNKGEELSETSDIIKKIRGEEYNSLKISREFKGLINNNIGIIKENPTDVKNIYSIFRGIRGFTEISKILYPYLKDYAEQYDEKRSVIVADEDNIRISFEREDVKMNINKLSDDIDKIIYGYIMIMNGRIHDLRYTKISVNKEEINDEGYNFIYNDKYYINNTKNKKKQILEISDDFKLLYNENSEGYILGSFMPASTLTQRIQRITLKIYGKIYTASNIRHLYATYINNKGASYKERKETATKAGHSIEQQIKYTYKNHI